MLNYIYVLLNKILHMIILIILNCLIELIRLYNVIMIYMYYYYYYFNFNFNIINDNLFLIYHIN
jgi:hypothetical protein